MKKNINYCKSCKYFNSCGEFSRTAACAGRVCAMQSVDVIMDHIDVMKKARDNLADVINADHFQISELFDEKMQARRAGDCDTFAMIEESLDALRAETAENEARKQYLTDYIAVLENNRKIAILASAWPVIVEEFTKYAGRPYGPKTRDKISDAIKARSGVRVYIDTSFSICDDLRIYICGVYESIDIYSPWIEEEKARPAYLIDNKINADAFAGYECSYNEFNYIENIDKYLKTRADLLKAAETAKTALEEVAARYNNHAVLINDRINTFYNLKMH